MAFRILEPDVIYGRGVMVGAGMAIGRKNSKAGLGWRMEGLEGLHGLVENDKVEFKTSRDGIRVEEGEDGTGMTPVKPDDKMLNEEKLPAGWEWDYCGWYGGNGGGDVEEGGLNVEVGYGCDQESEATVGMMEEDIMDAEGKDAVELDTQSYVNERRFNFEVVEDLVLRAMKKSYELGEGERLHTNRNGLFLRRRGGRTRSSRYRRSSMASPGRNIENREMDVTWVEAAAGMDVQGIPWDSLPFTREDYRATRLRDGRQVEAHGLALMLERKKKVYDIKEDVNRDFEYYCFYKNTRRVKSSIVHFQLRNLVWATSRHDVYIMDENDIYHWDAAACRKRIELGLSQNFNGSPQDNVAIADNVAPLSHIQVSTMIATDDWLIAGGFFGEIVAKNLKTNTVVFNRRITTDDNAITNAVDIFDNKIMVSNNDRFVRIFDGSTFSVVSKQEYPVAINHATKQPNGKLIAVVGDDETAFVVDYESGARVSKLHGHVDYSFATAWHPDGVIFATGSQDDTCRVWDVRNMSRSIVTLGGHMGAMRSVRFSSCGRFLALAEPRDFVHIYDTSRGDFNMCQEIDIFGEIAGISFSPDADSLFVGVWDRSYGSLLEYERRISHKPYGPNAFM